jgi:hypothetical protein
VCRRVPRQRATLIALLLSLFIPPLHDPAEEDAADGTPLT